MKIEVILLLYNRPDHTLLSLQALRNNGIKKVNAFLDFSDKPENISKQNEIKKIIKNFSDIEINFIERDKKLGLAGSIRTSLSEVFQSGAEAAILLEDDCILRPGGYEFFRQGLNKLKDNRKIRSLCGYLFPRCNFIFDPESDVMLLNRFSTWGWATWADRWQQYEPDLGKIVKMTESIGLSIEDFAYDQAKLCRSEKYLNNEVDIWSISWILIHFLTSTFAVYPRESVIENIGLDGSGENCENTEVFKINSSYNGRNIYNWKNLPYFIENEMIVRDFMSDHGLKTYPVP